MRARARDEDRPRSIASLAALGFGAFVVIAVLLGLGTWQVERRAWKLDLMARVDARVQAAPKLAPAPSEWDGLTAATGEYRHVVVEGSFLPDRDTFVQAVTAYGPGYWDLVPFRTTAGWTVLVNRGFVPSEWRDASHRPDDPTRRTGTVTGLLRLSEPGGGFLRANDASGDRWYSRDVTAIASRRGLGEVAPYFIDAEGAVQAGRYPLPGLTVVTFPNNHLVYALTWYGLAALLIWAVIWVGRDERRRRGDAAR